jgi:hypothetical protein
MALGYPTADRPRPAWPIRLPSTPALRLGRLRPALRRLVVLDAIRFSGGFERVFLALATIAIAYPVVSSVAHAIGGPTPPGDPLSHALRIGFDVVYTESIPFMVAGLAIGLVSPALGLLFVIAFVPTDLLAAAVSGELATMYGQIPFGAVLGRIASYALLWILVVEVPIAARTAAGRWAARRGRSSSPVALAAATALCAAVLVYLWAMAAPLIVRTVFTWSVLQAAPHLATDPMWTFWPVLVGAALVIGLAATLWPRPIAGSLPSAPSPDVEAEPVSMRGTVVWQGVAAVAATFFLGAMIGGWLDTALLAGGLLVAGPVLTVALGRAPVPGVLAARERESRVALGFAIAIALCVVLAVVVGNATFGNDYRATIALIVLSVVVYRYVAEAGQQPPGVEPEQLEVAR